MRRALLFAAAVTVCAQAAVGSVWSSDQSKIRSLVAVQQRLGTQIPLDLKLRDERGRMVSVGSAFGVKPVIITPVYYSCPMLCNIVVDGLVNRMADLRMNVGRDFNVITYSFDAAETSPEADAKRTMYLRRYGRQGAGEGWHFFTGDAATVKKLSDALGFNYVYDPVKKQFAHSALVIVATPDGKVSRYFQGINYSSRDLRLGLIDASGGNIGTVTDKLMLLCYDYDPGTGKYSATAMNVVRLGGTASIVALAGFIIISIRKERLGPHT